MSPTAGNAVGLPREIGKALSAMIHHASLPLGRNVSLSPLRLCGHVARMEQCTQRLHVHFDGDFTVEDSSGQVVLRG